MTRSVRMTLNRGMPVSGDIASGSATFGSDGTLTLFGAGSTGPTNWFKPTAGGVGANYWLRLTRLSGTSGVSFGAFQNVWTNLANPRTITAIGAAGRCAGVWEIAADAAGVTVLASGNISVNNTA